MPVKTTPPTIEGVRSRKKTSSRGHQRTEEPEGLVGALKAKLFNETRKTPNPSLNTTPNLPMFPFNNASVSSAAIKKSQPSSAAAAIHLSSISSTNININNIGSSAGRMINQETEHLGRISNINPMVLAHDYGHSLAQNNDQIDELMTNNVTSGMQWQTGPAASSIMWANHDHQEVPWTAHVNHIQDHHQDPLFTTTNIAATTTSAWQIPCTTAIQSSVEMSYLFPATNSSMGQLMTIGNVDILQMQAIESQMSGLNAAAEGVLPSDQQILHCESSNWAGGVTGVGATWDPFLYPLC
ncbi:hypothetical protein ACH5RR_025011 [Cinchona calisaya]|uniref:Uncharacterized protein n=1 Tax=Cinchona calisaya TaxID=153742 RepID=A0ABD2YYE5_9GENT